MDVEHLAGLGDLAHALPQRVVVDVLKVAVVGDGAVAAAGDECLVAHDATVGELLNAAVEVVGGQAAQGSDIDAELTGASSLLDSEALAVGGGGNLVEGHLDDRGDAALGACSGAGEVALPAVAIAAAGVGDMGVTVDHARAHNEAGGIDGLGALKIGADSGDLAIGYGDVGYGLAVFEDDGTAFNYEVVHCSSLR